MAFTDANMNLLTRQELWSSELKDVLQDDLNAMQWVHFLTEFPDGDTFTIPSIGEGTVRDYVEDTDVTYDAMDTGEFQFTITEYVSSGNYITDKQKQDSFYASQLMSQFIPKQRRAMDEKLETDVLALVNSQTSADNNSINGAEHRWAAGGTSQNMDLEDFARAKYALKKAHVPLSNLVAIVDPSVGFELETATNLVNVSNNPRWEGLIETGMTTGMRFVRNVYGFDVWESNYLPTSTETINDPGDTSIDFSSGNTPVVNMLFNAENSITPFIGAFRQMPRVEAKRNVDRQRDEFLTTSRYGLALYRPENIVGVISRINV
jgi:hypothetical protein